MGFYDLHVYTNQSIGESSLDEVLSMAKRLGIGGIGIIKFADQELTWPLVTERDVDIVKAVMVKAHDKKDLLNLAKKVRNKVEVLMGYGGNYEINRAICESSMFDVLAHPELGRMDSGFDHVCARAAAENSVMIEINFRELLEAARKQRSNVLSAMKKNVMLCKKFGTKIIVTSGALSKWDLRSSRDLAAVASILGLELGIAIESVSTNIENMLTINREKLAGKRWEGVSIE